MSDETNTVEPQQTTIAIGPLRLVGTAAVVTLFVVLGAIIGLIGYTQPKPTPLWLSGALWIAFISYWSSRARLAAPTVGSESVASRRLHQRLMNVSLLLLFVPVPGLTQRFVPRSWVTVSIGLAMHVGSFLLAVVARRHLGRNWSGAITKKLDHELIRSGPYAVVRHPIYTAMLGMIVGTALVSGQVHALIGVAIIAAAYWRKIPLEERNLREAFGEPYSAYRRETWALIPWLF